MLRVTGRFFAPALLLSALLAGCAFFERPQPPLPAQPLSPVQAFIVSRAPGTSDATGTMEDPAFGGAVRVTLEQEFLSASGETCRRASLFSPRGESEVIIMCRDTSGAWTMAPRIWGQGLPSTTTP